MKVWIFGTIVALLIPCAHVCAARILRRPSNSASALLAAFGVYMLGCLGGAHLCAEFDATDYLALLALVVFYCLGYFEAFSMLCRGFSLHILIDVFENKSLNLEKIGEHYGAGKGVEWLFDKRLGNLREMRLVKIEDGMLMLGRPWGAWVGALGLWFKKILKLGVGG